MRRPWLHRPRRSPEPLAAQAGLRPARPGSHHQIPPPRAAARAWHPKGARPPVGRVPPGGDHPPRPRLPRHRPAHKPARDQPATSGGARATTARPAGQPSAAEPDHAGGGGRAHVRVRQAGGGAPGSARAPMTKGFPDRWPRRKVHPLAPIERPQPPTRCQTAGEAVAERASPAEPAAPGEYPAGAPGQCSERSPPRRPGAGRKAAGDPHVGGRGKPPADLWRGRATHEPHPPRWGQPPKRRAAALVAPVRGEEVPGEASDRRPRGQAPGRPQ